MSEPSQQAPPEVEIVVSAEAPSSQPTSSKSVSIYHLYTIPHRRVILAAAALLALLTPFTDTVYLPALIMVGEDFDTTDSMVALTVSIYLACVGLGQLLWGPLADRYGRHSILIWALIAYLGLTIGCIFSTSIEMFLVLRSLQGFIVGSTLIIAQAVIADVFPGYERGEAMGAFMAPMLFGPVIAPLLGGIISQWFGWRACFIMLSVMTGPILFLTYLYVPETHHYYVKQRVHRSGDAATTEDNLSNKAKDGYQTVSLTETVAIYEAGKDVAKTIEQGEGQVKPVSTSEESTKMLVSISETVFDRYDPKEADRIKALVVEHNHDYDTLGMTLIEAPTIAEPVFEKPWIALLLIFDPLMSPFMLTCATSFALMFSALTIAPILLVEEPYSLSEGVVGVTFLSFGIGALLGALLGGTLSDASQRAHPSCKQGRMVYVLYFTPWIVIGGMIFAYAMQYGIHLSMVLIAQFVIGFVQSAILTNCMVYLGEVKPDKAAAACAVMVFMCFSLAAICVACTVPAASVITLSGFFWVMSGAYMLAVSGWGYVVYTELKKHSSGETVPTIEPAVVDVETAEKVISLEMAENQVATVME